MEVEGREVEGRASKRHEPKNVMEISDFVETHRDAILNAQPGEIPEMFDYRRWEKSIWQSIATSPIPGRSEQPLNAAGPNRRAIKTFAVRPKPEHRRVL